MIEFDKVTKSYPMVGAHTHYVLKDASAVIPSNQNIALLGKNGAGKSTLLRLLGGVESLDSGIIKTDRSVSWPITLKGGVQGSMSGRENCWFILSIHGYIKSAIKEKLEQIKELSGIGDYFEEPVKVYSSGMRVRLAFALCMSFDFDYFLLDEITSVGDQGFRDTCEDWILAEGQQHNIILVSHQMDLVRKYCHAAILIEDQSLNYYADLDEAISRYEPPRSKKAAKKKAAKKKAAKKAAKKVVKKKAVKKGNQGSEKLVKVLPQSPTGEGNH